MYSKEITPSRCLNSLCRISDIAARQRCLFFFLSLEVFVTTRVSAQPFLRSLFLKGYYQRSTAFSRHENFSPFTKKTKQTNKNKAPRAFLRPPQLEKFKAPQLKQHGGSDSVNIRDAIVFSGGLRLQFIKCGSLFFFFSAQHVRTDCDKGLTPGPFVILAYFPPSAWDLQSNELDSLRRQPLGTSIDFDAFDGQNDTKLWERVCCCCYFWHQREGTPRAYFLHLPAPTIVPFSFFLFFSFKFWIPIRTYWASSCWKATQAAWMCTVCYFKSCVTLKKKKTRIDRQ